MGDAEPVPLTTQSTSSDLRSSTAGAATPPLSRATWRPSCQPYRRERSRTEVEEQHGQGERMQPRESRLSLLGTKGNVMFWHLKTAVNESVLTHPPMCWNQRVPTCRMSQFLLMGQRLTPWR